MLAPGTSTNGTEDGGRIITSVSPSERRLWGAKWPGEPRQEAATISSDFLIVLPELVNSGRDINQSKHALRCQRQLCRMDVDGVPDSVSDG